MNGIDPRAGEHDALRRWSGLHALADDDPRWPIDPVAQGEAACRGGARVVQLRAKHATDRVALDWARRLRVITREHAAMLVVNDRFDLALAAEADAVHLGQTDLHPDRVARVAGGRLAIGRSTHTLEQVRAAATERIDYLAFGPVFGTSSKDSEYSPRGPALLAEVVTLAAPRPVVAIGGIALLNLDEVLGTGAHGAAVISAIAGSADPAAATRELAARFSRIATAPERRA
jgi:thiamine-phosphate pyrophosphorylase